MLRRVGMNGTMTPLADCPRETLAAIEGVLTDIDETVSSHGRLTAEAYGAMEALKKAGFRVVPVTGRPAGGRDHIARFWPVDAVVGENGAFGRGTTGRRINSGRASCRARPSVLTDGAGWEVVRAQVLRDVPGAGIASDQPYRAADLAIDFCEDVPPLPRDEDRPHREDIRGARRPRQGEARSTSTAGVGGSTTSSPPAV